MLTNMQHFFVATNLFRLPGHRFTAAMPADASFINRLLTDKRSEDTP
jgi:hypothetical protein